MDVNTALRVCNLASHAEEVEFTDHIKKAMRIVTYDLAMLQKKNTPRKYIMLGVDNLCPECKNKITFTDKYCRNCGQALIRY